MEKDQVQVSPPVQPQVPQTTQTVVPKQNKISKKYILLFFGIFVLLISAVSAYLYMQNKPMYNVQVYNVPTPTLTPTPTPESGINAKDSSDQSLNSDSDILNQDLNNVDADIKSVDQSFTDQQTNLQ